MVTLAPVLPRPMLLRSGPIPTAKGWSFEVKWDGFRALVSTIEVLRVRSRRGWDMTALVPELGSLPPGLVLDGALIASGHGVPHFPKRDAPPAAGRYLRSPPRTWSSTRSGWTGTT